MPMPHDQELVPLYIDEEAKERLYIKTDKGDYLPLNELLNKEPKGETSLSFGTTKIFVPAGEDKGISFHASPFKTCYYQPYPGGPCYYRPC